MTNSLSALKCIEGKQPPTIAEIEQKTNEFFNEADTDKNNSISLREFKSYVKKDKQVLEVLINYGIAQKEDLGTDFGSGGSVPDIDSDLDEECNPKGLK
jgi:short-subunit dehydrogenase involved in D-alanine esterification of teichoic acids